MFKIETISNKVVKGSALVEVLSFVIVDAAGALVSGTKAYDSEAEAQAKIDSLGSLSEGLAFAQAAFPELASKAQIGKANVVAAYLDWVNAGRPVKEVAPEAPAQEEAAAAAADPEAPAQDVASEEEEF